ncbi:hypothetical protein D805_0900 [Bifidobacterium thermophilum RBL67]|uniref:Uncharacterized protein n=1 Tax=Bifidobacterium thermophilum RBL67 TaxID=1254439 RepID=M4RRM8_9BIFI|nr:hypothetical protein D805_0900 [Bifidobacterium thermophilum RBL67]
MYSCTPALFVRLVVYIRARRPQALRSVDFPPCRKPSYVEHTTFARFFACVFETVVKF